MRNASQSPAALVGRLAVVLPLAAALVAGCRPGTEGGYAKVSHRQVPPAVPQAANPALPPPGPGLLASPTAQKIALANPPAGVTQAMVDQGQELFGTVCAACHGQGGTGTAVAPPVNDTQWLNITGQYPEIVQVINAGVPVPKQYPGPMPPKGGGSFDDAQVRALAAYVYALSHQEGGS